MAESEIVREQISNNFLKVQLSFFCFLFHGFIFFVISFLILLINFSFFFFLNCNFGFSFLYFSFCQIEFKAIYFPLSTTSVTPPQN